MNIHRVYLCDICHALDKKEDGSYNSIFIKKSLVYHYVKYNDLWIDLESKETYCVGTRYPNRLFIKKETMVPITSVIETKRDNMPKRKIIKMYKNTNGGKNEESI